MCVCACVCVCVCVFVVIAEHSNTSSSFLIVCIDPVSMHAGIQLSPVRFTTSPSLPAIGTAAVAPARTCADIWRHNTEQPPDGVYWIGV